MPIFIDSTAAGILITRGDTQIEIARPAVALALGPIIHELIDAGQALGAARREGYELGLADGRERALIEHETRERIACRQAEELLEVAALGLMASAA